MYELDDGLVQRFIKDASNMDWMPAAELAVELERQMPIPPPTNLGAVVQLADGRVAVRCDRDRLAWRASGARIPEDSDWFEAANLPRPFTVLSQGVEL